MIEILPPSAWLEFRGAPKKPGGNLTTHQALIADSKGQQHLCYVKAAPVNSPMPFAEALAWLVAEALDLPRPKFAALLQLPLNNVRPYMALDQHWQAYPTVLAFCTSKVDGKHIDSRWRWAHHLRKIKAYKHVDVARIAAFDYWIENQDRHSGNFLKTKAGGYIPIDNEYVLYSLLWVAYHASMGISVNHQSIYDEAKVHLKVSGHTKFKVSMMLASKHHEAGLDAVMPNLKQLCLMLVPDPAKRQNFEGQIFQFLQDRGEQDWMANELGLIP